MSDLIDLLERKRLIWQGRYSQPAPEVVSSGYPLLDEKLAGGLPKTGVVSIQSSIGIGELRILMNILLSKSRLVVFINPPGFLCAEFLYHQGIDLNNVLVIYPRRKNEALWAAEQCLKSGACSAVLLWQHAFEIHQVKRLKIACDEGDCLQFLMRGCARTEASLPVSLSMHLAPHSQGLDVSITKRKGGWPIPAFTLDVSTYWPVFCYAKASNVIPFPTAHHQKIV